MAVVLVDVEKGAYMTIRADRLLRGGITLFASLSILLSSGPVLAEEEEVTRVMIMPIEFEMKRVTAGGVQETIPEWTTAARGNLKSAMKRWLDNRPGTIAADFPELTPDQADIVHEHTRLLNIALSNVIILLDNGGPAWQHKRVQWDYSIGPGLAFLSEETGADKAVFLVGEQMKSTGGRVALAVFAAAMVGAVMPLGYSGVMVGLVDLRTGAIEWANYMQKIPGDLTEPAGANAAADRIMSVYPGGVIFGGT